MNPDAHSVHMALRAVVVYLNYSQTSHLNTIILKTEKGVTKPIKVKIQMYVELEGELDPSIKKVFIEVTHLGNNKFYFSDKSHVELIQEKPKSVLMIMETNNLTEEKCKNDNKCHSTSLNGRNDPRWRQFCNVDPVSATDEIFGRSPCRSPFASYLLKMPMKKGNPSINKNGDSFKAEKIKAIRVFALLRFWNSYPENPIAKNSNERRGRCASVQCSSSELNLEL